MKEKMSRLMCFCAVALFAAAFSETAARAEGPAGSIYEEAARMGAAGNDDGAENILKEALAKDRKDYRAMVSLSLVYQEKGDKKNALKLLEDAVKTKPDYPQAHFMLGRLHFLMQKDGDAVKEFTIFMDEMDGPLQALQMSKEEYLNSLSYIGETCNSLKRYSEAKRALGEMVTVDPNSQSAHYNLGVYYYNAEHDRPKAYRNFKKTFDLDPSTSLAKKAKYAIEFMRNNPDSRVSPDFSFIDQEYRE